MPKGQSESINRRTDNTMAKRKGTKGQATIYKTLHRKQKIEQHEPSKTRDELMCSGRAGSSCSTRGSHVITIVTNTFNVTEFV